MKKSLLFCFVAAACASQAIAAGTPTMYPGAAFQRISADGRIAVSEYDGTVTVYNLAEGTSQEFENDGFNSYTLGLGNCVTADGSIILGSTRDSYDPAYLQDGEWILVDVMDENKANLINGITPDGSRICGSLGFHELSFDEVIMQVPAYWDRNADGDGYGKYNILPFPTKDLFGETPQYLTAIAISSDGKTIVGQMRFSNGMMNIPIVYTEDAEGNWSYSLPTEKFFNPDGLTPVENPGDGPMAPVPGDYMTEEELEAYNEAVNEFYTVGDWSLPYPEYTDFMTAEEKAAYEAAIDKFNEENAIWYEKFYVYWDYVNAVMETSPSFVFNSTLLSRDNKTIISTVEKQIPNDDPFSWFPFKTIYNPATIDIATGEINVIDTDLNCLPTCVADNGIILGFNGKGSAPMTGYIVKDDNIQDIAEYIAAISPEYGKWINENMSHELLVGYEYNEELEDYEEIYAELTYTGMPVATPDMSVISIWNDCPWSEEYAEGVIFDMSGTSGIGSISVGNNKLTVDENGSLIVPADFVAVNIYNLSGACVRSLNQLAGSIKLNLSKGVYVAKGTRADGSVSVIKIACN